MTSGPLPPSTARSRAIYRLLLFLGPRTLRREHGAEMEELFLDALDHARSRGAVARAAVWCSALGDLILASIARSLTRRPSQPETHHERPLLMLGTDLTYTFRSLAHQKFSSALVVGMLTLGLAANVVVFGLVNGLFLRPFPFPNADRLVYINETAPRWNLDVVGVNFPDFVQWRQDARLFDGIALYEGESFNLSDGSGAERIEGARVKSLVTAKVTGRGTFCLLFVVPGMRRMRAESVVTCQSAFNPCRLPASASACASGCHSSRLSGRVKVK